MSKPLVEIKGFKELEAKIRLLANDKDKKKELLLILRQVAKPTLEVAKSLVPVSRKAHKTRGQLIQPGNLKKSLGFITGKSDNPTILVGPRVKGQNKGWYGAMVHEGHNVYAKGFKRKHVAGNVNDHGAIGRTKAVPYLKNAYSATNGMVTADAEKKVTAFIQRRIDKLSN
jgi:hypothetical protein